MKIILRDEKPICQGSRRLTEQEKNEVDEQIEEWLKNKIIKPSYSEFMSPIVTVQKNGRARVCIDYRNLNKKIIRDYFPLPIIDEQIDKLVNARVFSTLDL